MIEQDYVMRMIQDFGRLMRRLLGKEVARDTIEEELDAISVQWMGLPSSMLLSLPAEEVYRLIMESERLVFEKSFMMAGLCRAQGMLSSGLAGQEDQFRKSLYFFNKCAEIGGEQFQDEINRAVTELNEILTTL
jgi:hypothetical protein